MTSVRDDAAAIRSRGYRMTSQRKAILNVLRRSRGHISPVQVYERAHAVMPGLTEPTVYRTLEFLAQNRLVWQTRLAKGHLEYEFAGRDHHHLLCRKCGAEAEIEPALLQKAFGKLENASGYVLGRDHVLLLGVCPSCQKMNAGEGGS